MLLRDPVQITSRLLPGIHVRDGWVSIEYARVDRSKPIGRVFFRYYIDLPNRRSHIGDDLSEVAGCTLQRGLCSLLDFLAICGESYRSYGKKGDCAGLFPLRVAKWAATCCDDLAGYCSDLDENDNLIEE